MHRDSPHADTVHHFILRHCPGHAPHPAARPAPSPLWSRLGQLGTELWLDTGSLDESAPLWNSAFRALTTNNTLLNREVQRGQYDGLIVEAAAMLAPFRLSPRQRLLEIDFILNACHGLRLVHTYDAFVSVEEHTDLADDLEGAVRYAVRYHRVCPGRFIVKIPFTPSGLLAARRLAGHGVPVNLTLGFSARQNYIAARLARPAYVNVFLGRLNSLVADNRLGDGRQVGEKAAWASQQAVRELRACGYGPTRQIGASLRSGEQIRDLAGFDVLTMPPAAATQFLGLGLGPDALADMSASAREPRLAPGVNPKAVRIETLWDIDWKVERCVSRLESGDMDDMNAEQLVGVFHDENCGDVLPRWRDADRVTSAREGKIPMWDHWKDSLAAGWTGLDAIMNLAGLSAFNADQCAMDARVSQVLEKDGAR